MRICFFGMHSAFSVRPLRALVDAGHDVVCVLLPAGGLETRRKPTLQRDGGVSGASVRARLKRTLLGHLEPPFPEERDPFAVAREHGIPGYWVGDASSEAVIALLRRERVEAAAVAFFNQLLRPPLLDVLPAGGVNVHPSLLPRHRGPSPLFWSYHALDDVTGLTLHRLTPGEDEGPVLDRVQTEVALGEPGEALLERLAEAAAALLPQSLERLAAGAAGTPQGDEGRSRAPRPRAEDRRLSPGWPARRVFHLVRGVGRWTTLVVEVNGRLMRALDAHSFDEEKRLPGEWLLVGDVLWMACNPGMVELRVLPL